MRLFPWQMSRGVNRLGVAEAVKRANESLGQAALAQATLVADYTRKLSQQHGTSESALSHSTAGWDDDPRACVRACVVIVVPRWR
jgi:hypothetical protein